MYRIELALIIDLQPLFVRLYREKIGIYWGAGLFSIQFNSIGFNSTQIKPNKQFAHLNGCVWEQESSRGQLFRARLVGREVVMAARVCLATSVVHLCGT